MAIFLNTNKSSLVFQKTWQGFLVVFWGIRKTKQSQRLRDVYNNDIHAFFFNIVNRKRVFRNSGKVDIRKIGCKIDLLKRQIFLLKMNDSISYFSTRVFLRKTNLNPLFTSFLQYLKKVHKILGFRRLGNVDKKNSP